MKRTARNILGTICPKRNVHIFVSIARREQLPSTLYPIVSIWPRVTEYEIRIRGAVCWFLNKSPTFDREHRAGCCAFEGRRKFPCISVATWTRLAGYAYREAVEDNAIGKTKLAKKRVGREGKACQRVNHARKVNERKVRRDPRVLWPLAEGRLSD